MGQSILKILAVKVGGLKKKSAAHPWPHSNQAAQIRDPPGSNHSQSWTANNFAALQSKDLKFSALKDLDSLQTASKVQEAISILRMGFALSK